MRKLRWSAVLALVLALSMSMTCFAAQIPSGEEGQMAQEEGGGQQPGAFEESEVFEGSEGFEGEEEIFTEDNLLAVAPKEGKKKGKKKGKKEGTESCTSSYTWSGSDDDLSESESVITISGAGTLTLNADLTANIVVSYVSDDDGVVIDLNDHTLTGTGEDSVIKSTASTVTLKDGTVTGGSAADGGGVYLYDSDFEMVNVIISGCSATDHGGGVYVRSSNFTMDSDSVITDCSAPSGGGICVHYGNGCTTTVKGTISSCTASKDGGGVYLFGSSSPTLVVDGGTITGCSSGRKEKGGGAIRACTGSVVTLNNATISNNTSTYNGGAIYADGSSITVNSGTTISGNTATYAGGGVCLVMGDNYTAASLTLSGGEISGNTANTTGGGVYAEGSSITVSGGTISGNTATSDGGGVYLIKGTKYDDDGYVVGYTAASFTLSGGSISGNTAPATGGGIYVSDSCTLEATSGTLANNTATTAAADIYASSSATITLGEDVNSGVKYSKTNLEITGWFEDTESSRYSYSDNITTEVTSTDTGTEYYLIAAHGEPEDEGPDVDSPGQDEQGELENKPEDGGQDEGPQAEGPENEGPLPESKEGPQSDLPLIPETEEGSKDDLPLIPDNAPEELPPLPEELPELAPEQLPPLPEGLPEQEPQDDLPLIPDNAPEELPPLPEEFQGGELPLPEFGAPQQPEVTPYSLTIEVEEGVVYSTQGFADVAVITLEAAEKEGYVFEGYALEHDGAVVYRTGDEILVDSNITLYAVYTQIETPAQR